MLAAPVAPAIRAVLLDLDGTILDTSQDIAAAANRMLAALGRHPLGEDEIRNFIGRGIANLVHRCMSATGGADVQMERRALESFEIHYLAGIADRSRPYPGVVAGLQALARAGIAMGCVTNKAQRFTEPLLERTGLRGFFGVVVSGDSVSRKKPDAEPVLLAASRLGVEPREALVVGDSLNDVKSARVAGSPVVVVPYGYREGLAIEAMQADAVFPSIEALARSITMAG